MDWSARAAVAVARYEGGASRDLDQRQLTQLANAAWAAGLSLLMAGRREEAVEWLRRAAARYRESWDAGAPPDSWGRPIAAMKALLVAGDRAAEPARWALEAEAAVADSPIGRYAAALALLVLDDRERGAIHAGYLQRAEGFPRDVADALAAIAAGDAEGYAAAVGSVLRSFERREQFLEDVPVADTVLVLQALAAPRGLAVQLPASAMTPPDTSGL